VASIFKLLLLAAPTEDSNLKAHWINVKEMGQKYKLNHLSAPDSIQHACANVKLKRLAHIGRIDHSFISLRRTFKDRKTSPKSLFILEKSTVDLFSSIHFPWKLKR
jgi:hypothetical protein